MDVKVMYHLQCVDFGVKMFDSVRLNEICADDTRTYPLIFVKISLVTKFIFLDMWS